MTQTDKLMKILSALSAILIIIGAILKLTHYPYGNLLIVIGFISGAIIDNIVINQLKKIIKQLKKGSAIEN